MTAQITTLPGGTGQAAVSGTVIRVAPGARYEIATLAPDGTVGPALTAARLVMAPNVPDAGDISVTLPDGTVLVFKGMIELFGSGAGLSAGGVPVLASLEDLAAPAAGDAATASLDEGGSSQAFNPASPGGPNSFGDAPEGRFDPERPDSAPTDDETPDDLPDEPSGPAFSEAQDPLPDEPDEEDHGDDSLTGGDGKDTLLGDAKGDLADGTGGDDTLHGGDGDDSIAGDAGDSMIRSTGGGDTIEGGRGRDKISGDAAGDLRDGSKGGDDLIKGDGDGLFAERKSVSVSPNQGIPHQGTISSTLKISGFKGKISDLNLKFDIFHSHYSDLVITLISPSGTEVLVARSGNIIQADALLRGGLYAGGVTLDDDGGGVPVTSAHRGHKNLRPVNPLSRFDGEDPNGTWTLRVSDRVPYDSGTLRSWGLEIETGGVPASFDDSIAGDAGGAIVDSAGGDDTLYGGEGSDSLSGDAGGDIGQGGAGGGDTLFGGDRGDILVGDAGGVIRDGGKGGGDALYGGDGNDTLYGDAANKNSVTISIEAGASAGDDTLEGGAGDDTLYGDAPGSVAGMGGKDTFVFNLGEATGDDVIKDYDLDDDTLRFDDVMVGADGDKIAALEKIVEVKEDGADVVITRTDGKGTIKIEGIAGSGEFDSVQDLADATTLEINA